VVLLAPFTPTAYFLIDLESRSSLNKRWISSRPLWFRCPRFFRIVWIFFRIALGPFQKRWLFDPSQIRAVLLVRDLYSTLNPLLDQLLRQGIKAQNIYLIDAGSTSSACLEQLASMKQRGFRTIHLSAPHQNYGPYALWMCSYLNREMRSWNYPYLVTDTDLEFPPNVPDDWLLELFTALNHYGCISKASLPLQVSDITVENRSVIRAHERALVHSRPYRIFSKFLLNATSSTAICTTDTTFSLYRPSMFFSTFSLRLSSCYSLKHLPWYSDFCLSQEYRYYQQHKSPLFGEWS